jgi:hypothetical protein
MICTPISSRRPYNLWRSSASSSPEAKRPFSSIGLGPIAQWPTIQAARAVALITSPPTPVEFSP